MKNLAKIFLSDLSRKIKPGMENKLHNPFFLKHQNLWRFVIILNKYSLESIRFDVFQPPHEVNSNITFAFYSKTNRELLLKIFEETENLFNAPPSVFKTDTYVALNWKLNLSNADETNEFVYKALIFFKKFFIRIRYFDLIQLKNCNELFDRKNLSHAYTRKKKTKKIITNSGMKFLRKTRPAIMASVKSYYYLN
ncbi:hypothetical protein SAMN04488130_103216 [Flavobacterium urumqiense]|uniref:Uncharacterized protein n=1 Tax=Flavobacterium urumqiense TaxID=935224 RepID=A0A1H5VGW1_9FLAO|nr:hypothetical protein SAMN04488130_103216 [Flavobacterium urumqiense]